MARTCVAKAKLAVFSLFAPSAKKVSVGGSFNDWNPKEFMARKDASGNWSVKVELNPGTYEYKFFVDDSWTNDPKCNSCVANSFGTTNCIIEVK